VKLINIHGRPIPIRQSRLQLLAEAVEELELEMLDDMLEGQMEDWDWDDDGWIDDCSVPLFDED